MCRSITYIVSFLQNEEDVYLLSKIADIVHAILGTYKVEALPMFNEMLPSFTKLLVSSKAVIEYVSLTSWIITVLLTFMHYSLEP